MGREFVGFILLLLIGFLDAQIANVRAHVHRHHRSLTSTTTESPRFKFVCVNGVQTANGCKCNWNYVGTFCQKKMMCATYERHANGSCISCLPGFRNENCEDMNCVNGEPHKYEQTCVCTAPYHGPFCDELTTEDVYLLYNSRVSLIGPLGALSILPLVLIYYGCEHFAKKRQIRRIERIYQNQTEASIDGDRVKYLLEK
ncbi:Acp-5 [Aphelenchoides besseyi]|nr:Acp-5 [Aphelenchoides besseyi]KAI6210574.1 Acp-5 [Aphelenchoides besseyi]